MRCGNDKRGLNMENKDKLILRPSLKRSLAFLVLASAGFLWGICGIQSSHPGSSDWVLVVACSGVILWLLIELLVPRSAYILIAPEGFKIQSLFRSTPLIRWSAVQGFEASRKSLMLFNFWEFLFFNWEESSSTRDRSVCSNRHDVMMYTAPEKLADFLNKKRAE